MSAKTDAASAAAEAKAEKVLHAEVVSKPAPKVAAPVKVEVATRARKKWHVSISGHGEELPDVKNMIAGFESSGQAIEYARISNEHGTEVTDLLVPK